MGIYGHSKLKTWQARLLVIGVCAGATTAGADFNPRVTPLEDAALSELRGGFLLDDVEIAIGLEQIIAIDGQTQVVNQLSIPNLNQVSPTVELVSNHQMVSREMNNSQILVANQLLPGSGIFTQIQNSLDRTLIQDMRTLNIELSNIGGFNLLIPTLDSHFLQSPGR